MSISVISPGFKYVPCLRWKQGEYQALTKLSSDTKGLVQPLIELPEINFDFEEQKPIKTIDQHIEKVGQRIETKWGANSFFFDMPFVSDNSTMKDGAHPADYVFTDIINRKCNVVPVVRVPVEKKYGAYAIETAKAIGLGCCIRAPIGEVAKAEGLKIISDFVVESGITPSEWDFILDLGAPNFRPYEGFAKLTSVLLGRIAETVTWRSIVIVSTSFPKTMGSVPVGTETIDRDEWCFYKALVDHQSKLSSIVPVFGDYTINHPDPIFVDMRILKPSATIRYAVDDAWVIVKGLNVRGNGFEQYRNLSKQLIESGHFLGECFSAGDKYISGCAAGTEKTGNLTTWRWVGTNHHIEKVVYDLSTFLSKTDSDE